MEIDDTDPIDSQDGQQRKGKRAAGLSAEELAERRSQFLRLMEVRFLDGKEGAYIDYTTVDDNEEWDDLVQIGRDAEDKYFSDDDDDL